MLAFFTARFRTWLLFAVAAPILSWLLGTIGDRLEARHGRTPVVRALQTSREWLRRRTTGRQR